MPYQPIRSALSILLLVLLVPVALCAAVLPAGPEISVRVAQAGYATNPLVGVFPDGGFVVAWSTGSPISVIHARLFDTAGAPASGEFSLIPAAPGQHIDDLAVLGNGGFVVVWEQPRPANGNATSVLARRFDRQGRATTDALLVQDPGRLGAFGGRAVATPDGGFALAWTGNVRDNSNGGSLLHLRSDTFVRYVSAEGARGPSILVARGYTADDSYQEPAALATAADGTLVLAADCVCDQPAITIHRIVPGVGVATIDPDPSPNGELELSPTLAMAADGSFLVAWQTGIGENGSLSLASAIKARRFGPDGAALGDPFQVNRRGGFAVGAHAAALANGETIVAWTEEGGRDGDALGVFSRGFGLDGSTSGPDVQLNRQTAGDQALSSVAGASQGVAVWVSPGSQYPTDPTYPVGPLVQARRILPN